MLKNIDVTVVTPFYKGNEYMKQLFGCVYRNAITASNLNIEFIVVNDSPECEIEYDIEWVKGFDLKIVKNIQNSGIQKSRINGIKHASGKYILMLDQDDLLEDNAIKSQVVHIESYDIVVANGMDENPKNYGVIYPSEKYQKLVTNEKYYYLVGNMIVSPGQCLIKKSAIPTIWLEDGIQTNGSDDLLLWLLMLYDKAKWAINPEMVYTHTNTGENVSADFSKMTSSSMEVLGILKNHNMVSRKNERIFIRRFKMRSVYEGKRPWKKVVAFIYYPDISLKLLRMKL